MNARLTGPRQPPADMHGTMLLGLLIGLGLASITLMAAVDVWTLQRQREREQQLLFVGDQYRQAIQRYYFAAPSGSPRVLPPSLELLLEDDRYPAPVRHLRRLYPDPVSGNADWGKVLQNDRIAGVHSLSEVKPLKQAGFTRAYENFNDKARYSEWVFAFATPLRPIIAPPSTTRSPVTGSPSLPARSVKGK